MYIPSRDFKADMDQETENNFLAKEIIMVFLDTDKT
jgi:hypothetical protein